MTHQRTTKLKELVYFVDPKMIYSKWGNIL